MQQVHSPDWRLRWFLNVAPRHLTRGALRASHSEPLPPCVVLSPPGVRHAGMEMKSLFVYRPRCMNSFRAQSFPYS